MGEGGKTEKGNLIHLFLWRYTAAVFSLHSVSGEGVCILVLFYKKGKKGRVLLRFAYKAGDSWQFCKQGPKSNKDNGLYT